MEPRDLRLRSLPFARAGRVDLARFVRSDTGWLITVFVVWRLVLTLWTGWVSPPQALPSEEALRYLGPVYRTYRLAQPHTHAAARFLLDPWYRWDAGWYLGIAVGYSGDGVSAYAPLYPWLVRWLTPVALGNPLLAGLVVSNVSLMAALQLLLAYVRPVFGAAQARLAVLLVLLYPFNLFLTSVYSEALFLCLALATLVAVRDGHWGWAMPMAALAVLARFAGVVLIVPIGWAALRAFQRRDPGRWLALAAMLAALATLAANRLLAGGAAATAGPVATPRFTQTLLWPWASLALVWGKLASGPMWEMDWVNLVIFAGAAVACLGMLRGFPTADRLYAWSSLALPLVVKVNDTLLLFGMTRYVVVIFPVFVVWANWLAFRRWLQPLMLVTFGFLQLAVVWMHAHWAFVG